MLNSRFFHYSLSLGIAFDNFDLENFGVSLSLFENHHKELEPLVSTHTVKEKWGFLWSLLLNPLNLTGLNGIDAALIWYVDFTFCSRIFNLLNVFAKKVWMGFPDIAFSIKLPTPVLLKKRSVHYTPERCNESPCSANRHTTAPSALFSSVINPCLYAVFNKQSQTVQYKTYLWRFGSSLLS